MGKFFKTYFWDVIVNHYFDFKGKAARKQFWLFTLIVIIILLILVGVIIILGFINDVSLSSAARSIAEYIRDELDNLEYNNAWNKNIVAYIIFFGIISLIISGIVLAPIFSIIARRLHDINKSGWWQLISWIPDILFIISIIPFMYAAYGHYSSAEIQHALPIIILMFSICLILALTGSIVLFIFTLLPSESPTRFDNSNTEDKWKILLKLIS